MPSSIYKPKAGDTAVITGAGYGGIGYDVALLLASRYKLHVVLADNNSDALEQASKALITAGVSENDFQTRVTDVTDPEDMLQLAQSVFESRGKVDFLHLNAGISAKVKAYGEEIAEEWQRTFAVNLFGVVNGTQAFVDRMVAQDSPAAVVITGSKQGITNPPGTSAAYNASKAAVKTLAEALSHQLLSTSISVHLLIPGWTWTKLASPADGDLSSFSVSEKPSAAWSAAQVAEELLTRMQQGESYILCPDGAVNWELDKARMEWGLGDVLEKRPALSRWHPEWEEKHQQWVEVKIGGSK
ncbi:hypothetical protein JCM10908_000453 [Rhodotorula pacifica]|uniref:SDR family NAD(P)-dependent oxidoreductase n=1 Tax=Rhodotorula pacifica TaxID=1495444 RepID=UPI00317EEEB4